MTFFSFFLPFISFFVTALIKANVVQAEQVSFSADVEPILQVRCVSCHQPDGKGYASSGLDLRTYKSLMHGTRHGPVISPGNALVSNLNVLVEGRADPKLRMPHSGKKLTRCEIDILHRWVDQGALNN